MCGGDLTVSEGQSSITCDYCNSTQTIPNINNEKKANTFNRANALRLTNDFSKAQAAYESIVNEDNKDAEAHWGIVLCRYGIEYVTDPKTENKIPTCHRTLFKSIFDDVDYKAAIENSDVISQRIYQNEAEEINKIQKEIIQISQKESPFDIFICYKETNNGRRTKDSIIAQSIYEELTKKNYKVFFSRVTLEKILGAKYEPYIFSALTSAKVMLVIGSSPESFNSVWVKNEWSRFLAMMSSGKYLIPCYKDMEAYDMPEEFFSFQSQNVDKLGFLQDLIRGIDKIFNREDNSKANQKADVEYTSVNNGSLLKRIPLLIEDGEYSKANNLLEKVLNSDPENSKAYIYKLLIELNLSQEIDILKLQSPLDKNSNFKKAKRFADENYLKILNGYTDTINENISSSNYEEAVSLMNNEDYEEAVKKLIILDSYRDSSELVKKCQDEISNAKIFAIYNKGKDLLSYSRFEEAINLFNTISDYEDSLELIEKAKKKYRVKRK
jgi:hypothetical protein